MLSLGCRSPVVLALCHGNCKQTLGVRNALTYLVTNLVPLLRHDGPLWTGLDFFFLRCALVKS